MGSRALVTGGAGFIGSHLVRGLLEDGVTVRVLDDLSSGSRENLSEVLSDVELVEADLRDPEVCARACQGVDVVYHQAAVPSVPRSVAEPERTFAVNVVGTHGLLLAAREAGVGRVVQASSSSIYGDQPELPKRESMRLHPRSPYAAQKASAELLGRAFSASMGLQVVALRYFNVYGPRQNPKAAYAAVIAAFADAALRGVPATIHGDGLQTRDFTYVSDVVAANVAAGAAEGAGGQAFNIAGGQRISILDIHTEIARITGREDLPPVHAPTRAGDVRDSLASVDAARDVLGWTPTVPLATGLERTVAAMKP